MASGAIFVTGALGLESVGGFYWEAQGNQALQYIAATTTEELLEMLGIVLFMYALVDHIRRQVGPITVRVASAG